MAGFDRLTPQGKRFFAEIDELKKLELRVGFQHGEENAGNGADMADVAMWNELGTANAPPRPFIRQSVDNNAGQINAMCKAQIQAIVRGEKTAKDALQALGVMQKGFVQATIRNGDFTPNAPSTIKKKKSDKPLIDTGRMRQSVNFVIQAKRG